MACFVGGLNYIPLSLLICLYLDEYSRQTYQTLRVDFDHFVPMVTMEGATLRPGPKKEQHPDEGIDGGSDRA